MYLLSGQTRVGLPLLSGNLAGDQGQDLLGEGNDDAASQGQEAVGTLGGIVGLEGQTNLDNAPAQQDQTDGTDQAEDEVTQVIHHLQGITAGGCSGHSQGDDARHGQHGHGIVAEATLNLAGDGELFGGGLFVFLEQIHGVLSPF